MKYCLLPMEQHPRCSSIALSFEGLALRLQKLLFFQHQAMKIAESHLSVSPTVSAPSTGQQSSESPRMGRGAWEECGENVGWNPGDTRW